MSPRRSTINERTVTKGFSKTQGRGLSFVERCCFRVRVNPDPNPDPNKAFFKKKMDSDPDPAFIDTRDKGEV